MTKSTARDVSKHLRSANPPILAEEKENGNSTIMWGYGKKARLSYFRPFGETNYQAIPWKPHEQLAFEKALYEQREHLMDAEATRVARGKPRPRLNPEVTAEGGLLKAAKNTFAR